MRKCSQFTKLAKWGYSASQHNNNIGPLPDFYSHQFSCVLDSDEATQKFSRTKLAKWGYSASQHNNNIGPLPDFYSHQFSCVLDSDEATQKFSRTSNSYFRDFENLSRRVDFEIFADSTRANIQEQLIRIYNSLFDFRLNLRSGDTRLRNTTTISGLCPTSTVTSSVVFWTPTRQLRNFRGSPKVRKFLSPLLEIDCHRPSKVGKFLSPVLEINFQSSRKCEIEV
uniref:Uncharacterized protein n=1 Tax=Vespula pensylvanica TaxID=30213 RepID=A0A834KW17_VESPE|nr:hypothetical protein H0235_013036 [Vespula pensylvanica]